MSWSAVVLLNFTRKTIAFTKAPHLLCYRALEVQKGTSSYPVPCIYGTFVNANSSVVYNTLVVSTP